MTNLRQRITMADLLDLARRAQSVIEESEGAYEHAEIIGELSDVVGLCREHIAAASIPSFPVGTSAEVVILGPVPRPRPADAFDKPDPATEAQRWRLFGGLD